jgi:hypothetical protein
MKNITAIVICRSTYQELTEYLFEDLSVETMAIGLYRLSETNDDCRILIRDIIRPGSSDYVERSSGAVGLQPDFLEACLQKCETTKSHLLDIHTHPHSDPVSFSFIDDREAHETKLPYMSRYVPGVSIAFMVFGSSPDLVQARIWDQDLGSWALVPKLIVI